MNAAGVVIPAYNAAGYISHTIDSVLRQTHPVDHVVVVDDGCTDDTAAVVEGIFSKAQRNGRNPQLKLVRQPNCGVSIARNRGESELPSDVQFLLFLDNDDVLEPDAIEMLLAEALAHPEVGAVYGQVRTINEQGSLVASGQFHHAKRRHYGLFRVREQENVGSVTLRNVLNDNPLTSPGQMLIRRSALPPRPLFDPAVVPSDDWDLLLRITMNSTIVGISAPTLRYRTHSANVSRNTTKMRKSGVKMRLKWLSLLDWRLKAELLMSYAGRSVHRPLTHKGTVEVDNEIREWQ